MPGCKYFYDQKGSVAIVAALSLSIVAAAAGMAMDYARASNHHVELQAALDSAVLAAASAEASALTTPERQKFTDSVFVANCKSTDCKSAGSIKLVVNGKSVVGTVTNNVQTTLLSLIGFANVNVTAATSATLGSEIYTDIYLAVDISESMNIPDGDANIKALQALVADPWSSDPANRCAFACHTSGPGAAALIDGKTFFQIARENNIWLR